MVSKDLGGGFNPFRPNFSVVAIDPCLHTVLLRGARGRRPNMKVMPLDLLVAYLKVVML